MDSLPLNALQRAMLQMQAIDQTLALAQAYTQANDVQMERLRAALQHYAQRQPISYSDAASDAADLARQGYGIDQIIERLQQA